MRLITYLKDGQSRTGFLISKQVIDLIGAAQFWRKNQLSNQGIYKTHEFAFFDWMDVLFAGKSAWKMVQELSLIHI